MGFRSVRTYSLAVVAVAVLTLAAPTGARRDLHDPVPMRSSSRTLVAYTEEQGGVVFHLRTVSVAADRRAVVRLDDCAAAFRLGQKLWKRLNTALKRTDVHAVSGDHPPSIPGGENSTWVIVVSHDTVRITAAPAIPRELRLKLEPLLKVVEEVQSAGERRLSQSCYSKRTITGTA